MFKTGFKKYYIATALQNHQQALELSEILKGLGMQPTYEWFTLKGEPTSDTEASQVAVKEVQAVQDADVLIVIMPCGRGAYTEMGVALAGDIPIFVLASNEEAANASITGGKWGYKHIFSSHPNVTSFYGSPVKVLGELLKTLNDDYPHVISNHEPAQLADIHGIYSNYEPAKLDDI